jgi:hypothetical protein
MYLHKTFHDSEVQIIPSALPGAHAAVLGASALIWNELKK